MRGERLIEKILIEGVTEEYTRQKIERSYMNFPRFYRSFASRRGCRSSLRKRGRLRRV